MRLRQVEADRPQRLYEVCEEVDADDAMSRRYERRRVLPRAATEFEDRLSRRAPRLAPRNRPGAGGGLFFSTHLRRGRALAFQRHADKALRRPARHFDPEVGAGRLRQQFEEEAIGLDLRIAPPGGQQPQRILPAAPLVAVNERYASLDSVINEGDEVALIPPVAGG